MNRVDDVRGFVADCTLGVLVALFHGLLARRR
jgi:hypothetical protein